MRWRHIVGVAYAFSIVALRHPTDFLKYIARQGAAYERYRLVRRGEVDRIVDAVMDERLRLFLSSPPSGLLLQQSLEEICSKDTDVVDWHPDVGDGSELPGVEQSVVARIVMDRKPGTVFEIGTYRGRTTRLLAACAPVSTVHTLDLPPDDMLKGGCFQERDPALIGAEFSADVSVRSRIVQHSGDSRQFDFAPFYGQVDLVFVDASHAYEAVLSDSREAFRMIRNGGVILWDDYHPIHGLGVMKALVEISHEKPVAWIRGTRLAIHYPELRPVR